MLKKVYIWSVLRILQKTNQDDGMLTSGWKPVDGGWGIQGLVQARTAGITAREKFLHLLLAPIAKLSKLSGNHKKENPKVSDVYYPID